MEAHEILSQWKAKKAAQSSEALLKDCSTEGLALVLLSAICRINNLELSETLFPSNQPSPTAHAALTFELYGQPVSDGQSKEVQACWIEAYRKEYSFAIGDGKEDHGILEDEAETITGIDPCELSNDQLESREKLAAKLSDRGKRYEASKLLAMQGDRLTFAN